MKQISLSCKIYSVVVIVLSCLILAGCGSKEAHSGSKSDSVDHLISIGAHQPGIAYHSTASGIATVVTSHSDLKMTVKPFSGSNAWMPLLNSGEIDFGILSYPDAKWALKGINGYPEKSKNVRLLVRGNNIVISGFTVRANSGIEKVKDLKGKRVAANYSGNQIIPRVLEAHIASAGLTWDDVQMVPVTGVGAGVNALRENRVDAAFTGTPTVSTFLEADTAIDIDGLNWGGVSPENIDEFPKDVTREMQSLVPNIKPTVFNNGFLNEKTILAQYPIALIGSSKVSEETAYRLTKVLWGHYKKLHSQFTWLQTWTPEQMFDPNPSVPYHPGAIKFFKEQGLWTEEAEQKQGELLKSIK
ncbi:TAXI family TRAP transporter solute-binding subunit [Halobacillus shinanisalinarum]|uniref:TAXI family TRAP transporter solute-binding subunit n=1 Tax=Halobacillus shinanisalinarum TaxID=2932258 RepID=A0ABY4H2S2_9BACI|nr:TAXI family TRAP transporter solute-binding subunit [Halobacillus shinanisalinarum]UOQ94750.1 TAXI family TRAP transporter solute-binding subunit [Halobacillus shinanisalinarum]